jgi:eukaryotic-like serine/threonine-protein kinase
MPGASSIAISNRPTLVADGQVKILDFGLARPIVQDEGPTMTAQTDPGTVLGTVGYMAPEQVRGQSIDARTDLFAFGAVLYEMLSGQRAFQRETPAETMTAILKDDPPELTDARRSLPPALERIVRHCLEKNPAERFQSAPDVAFALDALSGSSSQPLPIAVGVPRPKRWLWPVVVAAVATVAALGGFLAAAPARPAATQAAPVHFEAKTFDQEFVGNARFMPDGQTIVFSAAKEGTIPDLFVSRANTAAPQPLGLTAHLLSISSKGELAVLTDVEYISQRLYRGTLARMPIDGAPRAWMKDVREADWAPDGSDLAIVHDLGSRDRLEYPVGHVLKETAGYFSDPRVSPDGQRVAFFEHPARYDDRGWVRVVDRAGGEKTLAGEYWGVEGLAWSPDGTRGVYAAAAGQGHDQPYSVDLSGGAPPREEFPVVGSVLVQDVAKDGRWIVLRVDERIGIRAHVPDTAGEREFSWINGGIRPTLSRDASLLLFTDSSESAGQNYAATYRRTSGGPVVRLGEGLALDLSPDDALALSMMPSTPDLWVYPIGPGKSLHLARGPLSHYADARWFPDSKRIVVCGSETGHLPRCYEQGINGGLPKPITPEGTMTARVSPNGEAVAAQQTDGNWIIARIRSGEIHALPGQLATKDVIVGWTADSRSVYVQHGETSARIDRVDVSTGARTILREIAPPDRAGLTSVEVDSFRDDGSYAYFYLKEPTTIFVVSGVRPGR